MCQLVLVLLHSTRLHMSYLPDLAFCNGYEDGTNTNSEPRQAYKTAEVGYN